MVNELLEKKVDSHQKRARVCLLLLCVFLVAGVFRTSVNADPTQLVASQSERYSVYQALLKDFPGEDDQVLVFTEAPVFDVTHLSAYQAAQKPLLDLPDVVSIGSLFSSPLVGSALQRIIESSDATKTQELTNDVTALLKKPDFVLSRFVSVDFDALLMTVALNPSANRTNALKAIESVLESQYSPSTGVRWSIAGNPAVELAIRKDVMFEIFRITAIAMLFGALIAGWALRNVRAVITVLAVPAISVVCTVGLMGWLSIPLTLLSQAVLMVVFLVVYTDTLHVLRGGRTVRSLMLACGLTSLTTSGAAVALLFANSLVIQEFGLALLSGIGVGFLIWSLWLLSSFNITAEAARWRADRGWPESTSLSPKTIVVSALIAMVVLLIPASQLRTGFSFSENLPSSHGASAALTLAENRFSGYLPMQVGLSKQDPDTSTTEFVEQIRQFQTELNVSDNKSLSSIQRWYSIADVLALVPGFSDKQRLSSIPYSIRSSLWRTDGNAMILAPHSVQQLLNETPSHLEELDHQVKTLANAQGIKATMVTGFPALIKEASDELLADAWRSVWLTLLVLAILVGGVLRSWRLALLAAVPVAFSLVGLASSLVVFGEPLRHIGVVLMTIVIGLSVDNALHLIVSAKHGTAQTGTALRECLPVLWVSTMTIVAGFMALTFSDIPSLSIAGLATAASLAMGFIASVLWLPPLLDQ